MNTCKSCRNILQSITKAGDYKIVESRCSIKLMDPVSGNEGEPECYPRPHLAAPLRLGGAVLGGGKSQAAARLRGS